MRLAPWNPYPQLMALASALIDVQAGQVLIAITLVALPIAAIAFARSGPLWQSLGKGRFAIEQELPPTRHPAASEPPVDRELQATEARQMLEAKALRQRRRGEEPLDVESEVARLLEAPAAEPPAIDEKLREEVRQLVVARNERRMRHGEQPLDVEAETERQLADL
jgi:hypothetical protein